MKFINRGEGVRRLGDHKKYANALSRNYASTIWQFNDDARKQRLLVCEFHTKANALNGDAMKVLEEAVERLEKDDYQGLVVYNEAMNPIEPGCGIAVLSTEGKERWFGHPDTVALVEGMTPRAWDDRFPAQMALALSALAGAETSPALISIKTKMLTREGVHSRLKMHEKLHLAFPPNAMTKALYRFLFTGVVLVIMAAVLIGVPFAMVLQWLVMSPLRSMIMSMAAFAEDPYRPTDHAHSVQFDGIMSEAADALNCMATTALNELVQRDKLASLGEAIAKINHDMRNVLSSAVLLSDNL